MSDQERHDGGCSACSDREKRSLMISMAMFNMVGPVCLFVGIGCAISGDMKAKGVKPASVSADFQKLPLGCKLEDVAWSEALRGSGKETYCVDAYMWVLPRDPP